MAISERRNQETVIQVWLVMEKVKEGVRCASVNIGTDVISMCVVPIKIQYGSSGKVLKNTCPTG